MYRFIIEEVEKSLKNLDLNTFFMYRKFINIYSILLNNRSNVLEKDDILEILSFFYQSQIKNMDIYKLEKELEIFKKDAYKLKRFQITLNIFQVLQSNESNKKNIEDELVKYFEKSLQDKNIKKKIELVYQIYNSQDIDTFNQVYISLDYLRGYTSEYFELLKFEGKTENLIKFPIYDYGNLVIKICYKGQFWYKHSKFFMEEGDILITKSNYFGNCQILTKEFGLIVIVIKEKFLNHFKIVGLQKIIKKINYKSNSTISDISNFISETFYEINEIENKDLILLNFVTKLLLMFEDYDFDYNIEIINDKNLKIITTYIDNNLELKKDVKIEDLEEKFNIKKNTLQELFDKKLQRTVIDYIFEKKMQIICEEMLTSNKKEAEILKENNLKNKSLFLRSFRKKYGLTPLKFRKKFKI
ncbi:helix-turn-helix domain-containing protein [Cetobacterium sp.]|uniref:helix-turn-helix domain-containing protein n=2 Tax=Cetobacterium sp. TaxID=2071632 RepID=UPI003F3EF330